MTTPRDSEHRDPALLRQRAEQRIADRVQVDADLHRLVHELQVHEIELAMQVEALRASHAELDAERARYVDLYDFAPMGYLTLSREGRIVESNLAAASMLGVTRAVVLRGTLAQYVALGDRAALQACLASAIDATVRVHCELRLATPSSQRRFVHAECMASADGAMVRISLLDITDRRLAEEKLLMRERAMQVLTHGIVITDPRQPDNPIVYVNGGFESLTGYEATDAIGRNCRFLQGDDTDPETVRTIRDAVTFGLACAVEILNYRKSGESYWSALSITPVRDDTGRLVQFIGVQVDISERRLLERALQEAQRMESVGRLAGGIAHDFSNLLTVINGSSDYLQGELRDNTGLREVALDIVDASGRATMLTRQLLAFGRRQPMTIRVLDLSLLLSDTAAMLRRVIGEDIDLQVNADAPAAYVRADAALLEQVLVNLALNARDAMPEGGTLLVQTEEVVIDEAYRAAHNDVSDLYHASQRAMRSGAYVVLTVSDTGIGMEPATVTRVFEPFFTTKTAGKGTGLGLSVVYGVVQQSHGYISVSSERQRGTTFRIFLPAAMPQAGELEGQAPSRPEHPETILLVEDDASVRALARRTLLAQGHRVLDARNGMDALRVADAFDGDIHLLLTDVVMPHMGGRALAETFRQRRPQTRTLFMSGYPDDEVLRRGVQQDQVAFLEKPFTQAKLSAKVREVLDAPLPQRGA